jgi:sugar lactone lactonase YvrE
MPVVVPAGALWPGAEVVDRASRRVDANAGALSRSTFTLPHYPTSLSEAKRYACPAAGAPVARFPAIRLGRRLKPHARYRWPTRSAAAFVLAALCLGTGPSLAAPARSRFDVRLFARVPDPGKPEGIAVDRAGTAYVGSSTKGGVDGPPSKVFAYSSKGKLTREYTIGGQDRSNPLYGLYGMAFDGDGLLYVVDILPPRIVVLDPRSGAQREYAHFRDVPSCTVLRTSDCSDTLVDRAPFPNYPAFGPDGAMYVTDAQQALIWRIPKPGSKPEVWFTNAGLETVVGPNGIGFMPGGKTLLFALTEQSRPGAPTRPAGLYTLPVLPGGRAGQLRLLWESRPNDSPDGFAVGRSGDIYLALAGSGGGTDGDAVGVISPKGREIARVPATEADNRKMQVPFDLPASVAFLGERALVTNHAWVSQNRDHYAVHDLFAGEPGLPLFRPFAHRGRLRIRILGAPTNRCVVQGFKLRIQIRGRPWLERVDVFRDGRWIFTTTRRKFALRIHAHGLKLGRHHLTVRAAASAGGHVRKRITFRRCSKQHEGEH